MGDPFPQAGDLRQRVTWQKKTRAVRPGSAGQPITSYAAQGSYWAEVLPLRGDQVANGDQLKPRRQLRVRMRSGPGIEAEDRLIFKGRALTVDSIRTLEERDTWLEIIAIESGAAVAGSP